MSQINPFLNPLSFNFKSEETSEQSLYHDLAQEITDMWGIPVYYIKRELVNFEKNPFGEDALSDYNKAFKLTAYFQNPKDGFDESSTLYEKFGLRLLNYSTFLLPIKDFRNQTKIYRPNEGDIICLENWKEYPDYGSGAGRPAEFFEIKEVSLAQKGFDDIGDVYWFTVKCEQWNYSNQIVNTGIANIDNGVSKTTNQDNLGNVVNDKWDDSELMQELSNQIIEWSPDHPFGTEGEYKPIIKPDEPGDIEIYDGNYSVVPTRSEQILNTKDKKLIDDINVTEIPYYEVDNNDGGTTYIISKE